MIAAFISEIISLLDRGKRLDVIYLTSSGHFSSCHRMIENMNESY